MDADADVAPDQIDNGIDPAADNTFKIVLENSGGVVTVTYFVNGTLSATLPLADVAPNGEFDAGFFISTRSQSINDGRGTTSVARLTVDESSGVVRETAPLAAAFTFDNDLQGFTRWTFDTLPLQDPTFSTDFGGSAKIIVSAGDQVRWRISALDTFTGLPLLKLQTAAIAGGTLSFDIIGDAGTLSDAQINRAIQPTGAFRFHDFFGRIRPDSVRPLPGGKEIARVTFALRSLVWNQLKPFVTLESNYKLLIGFGNTGTVERTYYLDNIVISPYSLTNRAKLDFAAGTQPFTAINGATIQASTVDPESLAFTSPPSYGNYVSGDFSSASADADVVAINEKLKEAALKGGYLQFTLKQPTVTNQTADFTYIEPLVSYGGNTLIAASFSPAGFVAGTTATDYERIFTVPLYPSSSLRTDGLLLDADQSSYVIELGVNSAGFDTTTWNIDDFEVIVNEAPQVISAPILPAGGGAVFGHVISNDDGAVIYGATGLPTGVMIDPATGLVTGTPTTNGTYNVVFTASVGGVTDSSDAAEWVVSNAANPGNLVPSITSFSYNGGNPVITWAVAVGSVNIQRSTTLAVGEWTTISSANTSGTYTDTTPPSGGKAFYRVVKP